MLLVKHKRNLFVYRRKCRTLPSVFSLPEQICLSQVWFSIQLWLKYLQVFGLLCKDQQLDFFFFFFSPICNVKQSIRVPAKTSPAACSAEVAQGWQSSYWSLLLTLVIPWKPLLPDTEKHTLSKKKSSVNPNLHQHSAINYLPSLQRFLIELHLRSLLHRSVHMTRAAKCSARFSVHVGPFEPTCVFLQKTLSARRGFQHKTASFASGDVITLAAVERAWLRGIALSESSCESWKRANPAKAHFLCC